MGSTDCCRPIRDIIKHTEAYKSCIKLQECKYIEDINREIRMDEDYGSALPSTSNDEKDEVITLFNDGSALLQSIKVNHHTLTVLSVEPASLIGL